VTSRRTCAAARASPGGGGIGGICLHRGRRFRGHGQQRSTASRFPLWSAAAAMATVETARKVFHGGVRGAPH